MDALVDESDQQRWTDDDVRLVQALLQKLKATNIEEYWFTDELIRDVAVARILDCEVSRPRAVRETEENRRPLPVFGTGPSARDVRSKMRYLAPWELLSVLTKPAHRISPERAANIVAKGLAIPPRPRPAPRQREPDVKTKWVPHSTINLPGGGYDSPDPNWHVGGE